MAKVRAEIKTGKGVDALGTKEDIQPIEKKEDIKKRPSYKELIKRVTVIAKPLASKKLTKKLHKTIKKGARS